jgi:hypothetical protein
MGYLERMGHGRVVKKILTVKQRGKRRMARPRLRWLEDVEKDLREVKVKVWRQKAVDRAEWASVRPRIK